jgi:hypothetical protein
MHTGVRDSRVPIRLKRGGHVSFSGWDRPSLHEKCDRAVHRLSLTLCVCECIRRLADSPAHEPLRCAETQSQPDTNQLSILPSVVSKRTPHQIIFSDSQTRNLCSVQSFRIVDQRTLTFAAPFRPGPQPIIGIGFRFGIPTFLK